MQKLYSRPSSRFAKLSATSSGVDLRIEDQIQCSMGEFEAGSSISNRSFGIAGCLSISLRRSWSLEGSPG